MANSDLDNQLEMERNIFFLLRWWFCLVASLHPLRMFCTQPTLKHRGSPWVVRVNTHSWVGSPQNPIYIYTIHVENQTSYYHISLLYILYHIMFTISSLVRITIWCHQIPPWVKPAKITVGRPPVSAFLAASAVGAMVGFLKKTSKDGFGRKRWESWENVGNSWKKLDTFEHVLMLLSFNGRGHGKI